MNREGKILKYVLLMANKTYGGGDE